MSQPSKPDRLFDHLWLAMASGVVAGLAEAAVLLFRRFALGRVIWTSPEVIWMAPLVYGIAAAAPGFLLAVVSWRFPKLVTPRAVSVLAIGGVALVASLNLLGGLIHPAVHGVIALGVGVQGSRLADRDDERRARRHRRLLVASAVAVMVLGLGATILTPITERLALGRLPDATAGARNVVLIVWDTVRRGNLSLTGYGRPTTPNLERWANRGVVFDRAIAPSSWTLPSHASFFTGEIPQRLSLDWNKPLRGGPATVAEVLSTRGYRTGGFVANLIQATRESGLGRGFQRYRDYQRGPRHILASTLLGQFITEPRSLASMALRQYRKKSAETVTDEFLTWLDESGDRPFFAFLNYFNAHNPYDAPPALLERFAEANARIAGYDAGIAYQDAEFDRLLRALQRRGLLAKTTVVLTADHGELFGEHGLHQHGNSLYRPLIDVPLMVVAPGHIEGGRRVSQSARLSDLAATVVEQAIGQPGPVPGQSLSRFWTDTPPPDTVISGIQGGINSPKNEPISKGAMNSIVVDRWHYILAGDGSKELFDWSTDPDELTNLAQDPSMKPLADSLHAALVRKVPPTWLPGKR